MITELLLFTLNLCLNAGIIPQELETESALEDNLNHNQFTPKINELCIYRE